MARRNTGGRARAMAFLGVSLIAAIAATVVIYNLLQGFKEELARAQEKEALVGVVSAKQTLYQGTTLTPEHFGITELPEAFIPEGTFSSPDQLVGRVPLERILQDELVRVERLAPVDAGTGLNAIIPRGYRAYMVQINESSSVAGFLNPGNYVDILVTIEDDERNQQTITMLEAVRLLAVANRLGGTDPGEGKAPPTVTLAVTPEQVEKIVFAKSQGEVTLTLRNDVDVLEANEEDEPRDTANIGKLIGRTQAKVEDVVRSQTSRAKGATIVKTVKQTAPPPIIYHGTRKSRGR